MATSVNMGGTAADRCQCVSDRACASTSLNRRWPKANARRSTSSSDLGESSRIERPSSVVARILATRAMSFLRTYPTEPPSTMKFSEMEGFRVPGCAMNVCAFGRVRGAARLATSDAWPMPGRFGRGRGRGRGGGGGGAWLAVVGPGFSKGTQSHQSNERNSASAPNRNYSTPAHPVQVAAIGF